MPAMTTDHCEHDLDLMPTCPCCGENVAVLLGQLGPLTWVRCRACGMDYTIDDQQKEDA